MSNDAEGNYEYTQSEVDVRDKILHTLKIFPRLSVSQLQMGIGPSLPSTFWKPLLEQLIKDGQVYRHSIQAETPKHRIQVYTVYTLYPDINKVYEL